MYNIENSLILTCTISSIRQLPSVILNSTILPIAILKSDIMLSAILNIKYYLLHY